MIYERLQKEGPGYEGIDPRSLPAGLREQVTAAIAAAEGLNSDVKFTFTEAPPEQLWDFPVGIRSVYQFTDNQFSGFFHFGLDGSQFIGEFSSTVVDGTGNARAVIAESLGYDPSLPKIRKPGGIVETPKTKPGEIAYFGASLALQRTATQRRLRPGATSTGVSPQVNRYRP